MKLKNHLIESFMLYLNQSLTSTILKGKEKFLKTKDRLIKELRIKLLHIIKDKIENNYNIYINFLLESIKKIKNDIDKPQGIELIFNSIDYKYFIKNFDNISGIFKNTIEINQDKHEFIGGFKISLVGGNIFYDYTIDNLIDKNSSFVQMEISKIINDSEIKKIEKEFENFIQNQKEKIPEYLRLYEQIQF
ncbi:MAG: hypothetical protein ACFE91_02465 [Promethearchaeota archaeon]